MRSPQYSPSGVRSFITNNGFGTGTDRHCLGRRLPVGHFPCHRQCNNERNRPLRIDPPDAEGILHEDFAEVPDRAVLPDSLGPVHGNLVRRLVGYDSSVPNKRLQSFRDSAPI